MPVRLHAIRELADDEDGGVGEAETAVAVVHDRRTGSNTALGLRSVTQRSVQLDAIVAASAKLIDAIGDDEDRTDRMARFVARHRPRQAGARNFGISING